MTVVTFLKPPSSTAAGKSSLQPTPVSVSSYFFGVQFLSSHCALKMSATTTTLTVMPSSFHLGWLNLANPSREKKNTDGNNRWMLCTDHRYIFPHPRGMIRMTEHFLKTFF
jgi:hypothetical protein